MFEKILPIGSVVLIKNAVKKAMIIGYMQLGSRENNRLYDYVGVMYPSGSLGVETQFLFDHEDIQDIIFTGYKNSEFDELINALEKEAAENPEFAKTIKSKTISAEQE